MNTIAELETNDAYTCMLTGAGFNGIDLPVYDHLTSSPMMHCLDIGSPYTLSGMPGMVTVPGRLRSVSNITNLVAAENATDDMALYGAANCGDERVSDGTINAYDVAVLLWSQFGRPPYDSLPEDRTEWADYVTVKGQEEHAAMCCDHYGVTGWTCADGAPLTKAGYVTAFAADKCHFNLDNATGSARRLGADADELYAGRALQGEWGADAIAQYEESVGAIEVISWATVQGVGKWYKISLPDTALALELTLLNVDPASVAETLTFKKPPAYSCDEATNDCLPDVGSRERVVVGFQRRVDLIEEAGFTARDCAMVFPAHSRVVDASGAVAMYQEPATKACPFDLFVWVPEGVALDSNGACAGEIGVDAGSTINDGRGGIIQHRVACAAEAVPSPPPPPPPPPFEGAAAAGTPPPPPALAVTFSISMGPSVALSDLTNVMLAHFRSSIATRIGVDAAFITVHILADEPGRRHLSEGVVVQVTVLAQGPQIASVVSAQLLELTPAETSELISGLPVAALGTPKVSMVITDAGSAPPPPPDAVAAVVVPGASGLAVGGGAGAADEGGSDLVAVLLMATPIVLLCVGVSFLVCLVRHRRKVREQNKVQPAGLFSSAHDPASIYGLAAPAANKYLSNY